MTSIDSLPPEILLQIFHWATYDPALFDNRPSWRNYDLGASYESEDPWPRPSDYTRSIATALALTCTRWNALATEFELRYITVDDMPRLKYYLGRIRKLVQTGKEGDKAAECPIRRMILMLVKERVWTEEDTEAVVSLIRSCPNLEVLINECFADGEMHAAGPVLLQSLADACPKLKRLHWKTMGCMQLLPSAWSTILASSSLATSLEALEIESPPGFPAHGSTPTPASLLELSSLHCLQLCVNEDHASLISAIVDEWQLPSLTSLYLTSSHHPTIQGVLSLISTHGQSLTTLAMDRSTSGDIPLSVLPPAPIQELVYNGDDLEETTVIPLYSLSTLVARLGLTRSRSLTSDIFAALELLHGLQSDDLTELKDVVVLEQSFDTLQEPHPIEAQGLTENQRLWVERWQKDTPRLVNRNGVRLFALVSADGRQH
ncbi:hypothetical protein FS837_012317 [Tulasnella sp. UAMH 9824]|nr:hypothetical protein FS837_012317 [Tulasnella sp. UAMH 9824]